MAELVDFLGNLCNFKTMLEASVLHGGVNRRMGRQQFDFDLFSIFRFSDVIEVVLQPINFNLFSIFQFSNVVSLIVIADWSLIKWYFTFCFFFL